jgi:hypothetical protein
MKNYTIEIKWAIRFTMLTLAWAIGEQLIGLHDIYIAQYGLYTNLIAVPALLFYFLALQEKKKYFFNGTITWSQGFVSGVMLSFIIALMAPIAQFVIYKSITPHFFETIIAYKTNASLVSHPISKSTAEGYFNLKSFMLQSAFSDLSTGVIVGALLSLFIRNKK